MDQAIKLFGRTIPFSETHDISTTSSCPEKSQIMDSSSDITKAEVKSLSVESVKEPEKLSTLRDNKEKDDEAHINPKAKEEQSESSTSSEQDKSFKKPDKIIPCPRCNSLDTKFCYFNNYNVNQPRHFCKNCQRYWTAGGTMRNVPIGAGRRKNKHLASQFHQIIASTTDGVLQNGFESTNSDTSTFSPQNRNGIILKFGPEAHFCDSTTTRVSSYEEPNRCPKMHSVNSSENGTKANESPQSVTRTEHVGLHGACNELRMSDPLPYCPVPPPLVFPWNNQAGNNLTSCGGASQYYQQTFVPNGSGSNQLQYYPTPPVLAVPGTCPSSIPLQFVPTGYWGSIPIWAARPGNIPLNGSFACFSPPQNNTGYSTGNGSPTLGKHCRDANFIDEEKLENCVMVPKVLRTDEPDQA